MPGLVFGAVAVVNNQPTYEVPPGTSKVLILDLTLPEILTSIKIKNAGNAQQIDISQISVFEDGSSPGWDGDEKEVVRKSLSPFFDTLLSGTFSKKRIFVTVDIPASASSGKTIKPQVKVDILDEEILGLERTILAGASSPTTPVAPLAGTAEALSTSTIRWHFTDMSNNEFGFKILDGNLNTVVKKEEANLSYLDEIGLSPDTEYSGRMAVAFNDRGESLGSSLAAFSAVRTLELPEAPAAEEVLPSEEVEAQPAEEGMGAGPELTTVESLRAQIQALQLQLIELLKQLIQVLRGQLVKVQNFMAGLWTTFFQ